MEDDCHPTLTGHAGEAAFSGTDPQGLPLIVPSELYGRKLAARIAHVATLIFVQGELAVGSGKDMDGQRPLRIFAAPLHIGTGRDDCTSASEQRHPLTRRIAGSPSLIR